MKESRKLNNIYKIRLDNIEVDINRNQSNNNTNSNFNYENRHSYDSNQFVKPNNTFVNSTLNNNTDTNYINNNSNRNKDNYNSYTNKCCCCCTCCCCKDNNNNKKNASQVILSLINKSTKCPKCNSEFYDLSTSFLNKSTSKIYKYKSSSNHHHNESENTSKSNRNYLEKINSTLSKLQSHHNHQNHKSKTSSPLLNHTLPVNGLSNKHNKTITSKLDYSQYIKSPLIQNIKLYKPKESSSSNYHHNIREPVQAIHPNLDTCTKQTSTSRFTKVATPKLINENKNYGTNFFLNVYNINDTQVEHKYERKTSAHSINKHDLDNTLVSTPRRQKQQLNESNISSKPPPPVKIRTSTHNLSKLNESLNQTVNNLNESLTQNENINNKNQLNNSNVKLFMGNTSSLRGNHTMTNLTNGGDLTNLSKRSNLTSNNNNNNNNNNNSIVTIEDDVTQNIIESNIDFTKTMSSNDFSNYIDKIINQFRNKTKLYSNNMKNTSEKRSKESVNNLSKLKTSEINRPLIPKIESNLSNNNNNNTIRDSFVSNVTSRHATKATVTPETYVSRLNESVNEQNSQRRESTSRRSSQTNDSNYLKHVEVNNRSSVVERRSDFIEGSSFINFTHSYEIEEDDDDMDEDEYEEYINNDEDEDDGTTNEQTLNSSQS